MTDTREVEAERLVDEMLDAHLAYWQNDDVSEASDAWQTLQEARATLLRLILGDAPTPYQPGASVPTGTDDERRAWR